MFSKSIINSFANDTNLIFLSKKLLTIIESVIHNVLKHLVQWLRGNRLSLNETKTELIIFRWLWKQLQWEPDIRFNSCKLKLHTGIKYLGIFINEIVSWNKQIEISTSKLSRANGILCKMRHLAPLKTCLSAYYSIFYSHLLHGCLAWSYTKKVIIDQVNKLQKRCIQILTFSNFNLHTIDLFKKLKMLKVQDAFILNKHMLRFIILKVAFLINLSDFSLSIMIFTHL